MPLMLFIGKIFQLEVSKRGSRQGRGGGDRKKRLLNFSFFMLLRIIHQACKRKEDEKSEIRIMPNAKVLYVLNFLRLFPLSLSLSPSSAASSSFPSLASIVSLLIFHEVLIARICIKD
jgi:hypothetical protein